MSTVTPKMAAGSSTAARVGNIPMGITTWSGSPKAGNTATTATPTATAVAGAANAPEAAENISMVAGDVVGANLIDL